MTLTEKTFEDIEGKGENAGNKCDTCQTQLLVRSNSKLASNGNKESCQTVPGTANLPFNTL